MMSIFAWCTRRSGGLAMIALILLSYWVLSKESNASRHGFIYRQQDSLGASSMTLPTDDGAGYWTIIWAYYCLLIHVLVFIFPLRACWALWDITVSLKKTARSKALRDFKCANRRRSSSISLSSSDTLTSSRDCSASSSEAGDFDGDCYTDLETSADRVIHAVVIPNYKEEMDTLRETLEVLGSHPQALHAYDIILAMEQRETNVEVKATALIQEFVKKFRSIDYTLHPADIPGEAAGKGSNVAWAARKLSQKYKIQQRKDVIITGIDADSHLSSDFFALITQMHLAYPETARTTLYSAPIIFDRNAHLVPAIVRVADILWCAAGVSGLYAGSSIAPPTSVYSLPLELVDRVGGWDCDNEAIGEDLHMYLKCFFALNGNLTTRTVLSPISQSNVTGGGAKGIRGVYADMRARYKQALRHMWGALDTGFALRKVANLWQERKHTVRVFRPLHTSIGDSSDVYFPESQVNQQNPEHPVESGIFSDVVNDTIKTPNWTRIFYLFHRLFEAHFLPVQMTILVVTSTLFVWLTEGNDDPHSLNSIFYVCNILRTLGFMEVAFYLFLYEGFHKICVRSREREMIGAGLAEGMRFSHRSVKKNFVDYIMVPLVAPLYGAIPCAQAQVCHFWTLDLVYTVSKKVTRRRAKSRSAEEMA